MKDAAKNQKFVTKVRVQMDAHLCACVCCVVLCQLVLYLVLCLPQLAALGDDGGAELDRGVADVHLSLNLKNMPFSQDAGDRSMSLRSPPSPVRVRPVRSVCK